MLFHSTVLNVFCFLVCFVMCVVECYCTVECFMFNLHVSCCIVRVYRSLHVLLHNKNPFTTMFLKKALSFIAIVPVCCPFFCFSCVLGLVGVRSNLKKYMYTSLKVNVLSLIIFFIDVLSLEHFDVGLRYIVHSSFISHFCPSFLLAYDLFSVPLVYLFEPFHISTRKRVPKGPIIQLNLVFLFSLLFFPSIVLLIL